MFDKELPENIKWAILGIAISWFFWGPVDGYYALYLKSFNLDYSQIGWFLSIGKLLSLVFAIPIGILVDKFSPRKIVIGVLFLYLILPILYFYAGLHKLVYLLIICIFAGGLMKIIRDISMDTYIKYNSPFKLTNKIWAFHDGIIPFFWALGVITGSLLILYFEVYQLFLLVPIGILIKLFIFYKISEKNNHTKQKIIIKETTFHRFQSGVRHFFSLKLEVLLLLFLTFLGGVFTGNMDAFLGLYAEAAGYGLVSVGFLVGFVNLAFIFSISMSKFGDLIGRYSSMTIGQMLMAFFMFLIFLYGQNFFWMVLISFFLHWLAFQLIRSTRNALVVANTPNDMQGEITSIQVLISAVGNSIGSVFFGYISDIFGIHYIFLVTAIAYLFMAGIFWRMKNLYESKTDEIEIHRFGSIFSRFHIGFLPHSLTHEQNYLIEKKKQK